MSYSETIQLSDLTSLKKEIANHVYETIINVFMIVGIVVVFIVLLVIFYGSYIHCITKKPNVKQIQTNEIPYIAMAEEKPQLKNEQTLETLI